MSNVNKSMTGDKPKKKYAKKPTNVVNVTEITGLKSSFDEKSLSMDFELSSIHSHSQILPSNTQSSFLKQDLRQKSFISKSSKEEVVNLFHDSNYKNLKQQFQQKQLFKSLKKYMKKAFPMAKQIEIFFSTRKPQLEFQYHDSSKDNLLKRRPLNDLLKANKDLGEREFELIKKIFDQLYCRINESELKIQKLITIFADKKKIELDFSIFKKHPQLYYEYDQKVINFTFFDKNMRIFQFSSQIARECKVSQAEQKKWNQFIQTLQSKRQSNDKHYDQYGQHEVSSDEERHYYGSIDAKEIQSKIKKLFDTDLTVYEEQIQQLDFKCQQLIEKNDDKQKENLQRLADQVHEHQYNLDNFKQAKQYVIQQLEKPSKNSVQKKLNLLKMLIIAEKQLKSKLPIVARKKQIFSALNKTDLIILEGQTGSGKSTQLPQMLCEYLKIFQDQSNKVLPILITQPRRLATRTVAERVADQMQQKIGGFVDYATSSYKPISKTAKIIFKLDSVVLDQLTSDRLLKHYSCLIIDEAHERTISIDVILGLIKELQKLRKGFKVIVTSASLDGKLFSQYFKTKVMKVSGRLYPVDIIYQPLSHQSDLVKKIQTIIKKQILYNNSQSRPEFKGDILVFCSGVQDINMLCNIFQKYLNPRVFRVLPLHGRISVTEQREVFIQTKQQKVIFASRIAQTSITINGIKVVIDPGVDRQMVYDQRFRVSSRKIVTISQSSAKQRAGRAGRTSRGYCFRLYSQKELGQFRVNKTPEIDNMALDTLVLRLKALNVNNIFTFQYVKAPDRKALQQSIETLQMIGGLSDKQQITTIGRLLIQLHIEPFLGRSIIQAIILDYITKNTNYIQKQQHFKSWDIKDIGLLKSLKSNVIEILCMVINSSNLFYGNVNLRDRIEQIKYTKFADEKGDFFYLSNIYSEFYHRQKEKNSLDQWIKSRYLNKKTLFQTKQLIEQINEIIKSFKFDIKDPSIIYLIDTIKLKLTYCKNVDDAILSCMVTSFCVNLCLYSQNPRVGYTIVLQKKPVSIYGTSTLALQGLFPKWIVCYDLKTNEKGITYCTIAHEVNFNFLKLTVEDFVFNKLKLKQAQHMNPFYQKIQKILPTTIIKQIQHEYYNSQDNNIKILQHLTFDIEQDSNKISIFYSKGLLVSDIFEQNIFGLHIKIYDLVNDYIEQKLLQKGKDKLITNITSNIFLEFTDGFLIKCIHFADLQVQFLVKGQKQVLNEVINILQGINAYPFGNMIKIVTFNSSDQKSIRNLLTDYMLEFDSQKKEKKEQTLNGKIFMKFYTGKLKKQPIFLYYGNANTNKSQDMVQKIYQIQQKFKKQPKNTLEKYAKMLCDTKFSPSFKKTGIKCFNNNIDAFELKQTFQNLIVTGRLPFDFEMPKGIQQFRDTESSTIASRSQKQWVDDIQKVFLKFKLQGLTITVQTDKQLKDDPQARNMQKLIKQELTATISSKSLQTIDEMVRLLDGKEGIIGLGKIHFRYNYQQLIIKVSERVFKVLYDEYQHQKNIFENTLNVKIDHYKRIFGKVNSIFISCRSPIRQNLLKPTEYIRNLFTPFMKRLSVVNFNFLNETGQGEREIQAIQDYFDYKIYFGFNRKKNALKIYCQDGVYADIQYRIDRIFQTHHLVVENISYKGKGLSKVQEVLQSIIKSNEQALRKDKQSKLTLYYTIVFRRREVQITGDRQSIERSLLQIQKINNTKLGSCNLCNKNVQKPFRLYNCQHEFCSKCLSDYIQQIRKEQDDTNSNFSNFSQVAKIAPLVCPHDNCGKAISAADIQNLLSTEQFQSLSMKKLKDFVTNHNEYFFCPTAGCEQIFQEKKIKERNSFECVMCGRWFCSVCKQPHQHFTCEQWTRKLRNDELLSIGFKKCVCGYVLQKKQKGKVIRCISCHDYLCWSCNKSWKQEKPCADHVRVCKN